MITIYHNPLCSKSRETLALIQGVSKEKNLPLSVVDYVKTPLTLKELRELRKQLAIGIHQMVRNNEPEYTALSLEDADEQAILQAMVEHPRLMQRPIVTYEGRAIIGRPPESVLRLFDAY